MRHRRTCRGLGVCLAGAALALAPLTAAASAASRHHPPSHTPSTATMCADVKKEQESSTSVGLAIERALQSGNFGAAKQEMLNAYDTDLGNVQKAYGVIKQAPPNVQAAFKDLLTFVQQIRADIQNANNEQELVTSFESLGKNTGLATDGTTIANWVASKCGTAVTTTTSSLP